MRPQRLYKTAQGRYYFVIDGVRKYIRIPKGMTESELLRLNLKTILKLYGKRVKGRKKRKMAKFEKPVVSQLLPAGKTASSAFVEQGKPITEISDVISGKERKKREALYDALTTVALSNKPPVSQVGGPAVSVGPLPSDAPVGPSVSEAGTRAPTPAGTTASTPAGTPRVRNLAPQNLFTGSTLNPTNVSSRLPPLSPVIEEGTPNILKGIVSDAEWKAIQKKVNEAKAEDEKFTEPDANFGNVNATDVSQRLRDPVEVSQSKKRLKKYLRTGEGTLASEGVKPKSTEQKLAETPSFSASTGGITEPASLPKTEITTKGPPAGAMPVSLYETAKAEYLSTLSPEEQAKQAMGFGEDGGDGLYNDELAQLIRKRVGQIVPVLPSDKVNQLLGYVVKGDKKFAAVINTNPSQSDGSGMDGYRPGHWRAIFIDNRDDYPSCEYFDPLAEGPPEKSLVNVMKKICRIMNPEKMCLYKQSNIRRQAKEKSTCGWHVAQFIDDRWNGESWADASGYNHYMQSQKEAVDDSTHGEKEVSKYIKKYNRYI
jgi:hypothetical protein